MNSLEEAWRKEIEMGLANHIEAELIRQMEIELMWGTKLPIQGKVFKLSLYQRHKTYLIAVLKLSGL